MNKVVSHELIRLVSVFRSSFDLDRNRFLDRCVNSICSEWQLGAPIGDDAWYAVRLALLEVLLQLVTPTDGMKVVVDEVNLSRGEIGATEKGWCSLAEAYVILRHAGLLSDSSTEDERVKVLEQHYFRPQDVIGDLEYNI